MNNRSNEILGRIVELKEKRHAVILAHNYQIPEVQDLADFVGDSLELSQKASVTEASTIIFCGVHFMAETAKILSPDKTVVLPEKEAGCPMAEMITVGELKEKKAEFPGVPVVCYINSSASVKAESDICCTSANAVKVVSGLPGDEVIFIPDKYLGAWVAAQTDKKVHIWPGFCPTHARIKPEDIQEKRRLFPNARVVVHPECRPEVTAVADAVLSTSGMIRFASRNDVSSLIVGTEIGVLHRMQLENPGKKFIPVTERAVCPNMKLTSTEKVLWSLQDMEPRVDVPENIRLGALSAVRRMLETV
jgi:quinolinate synthase